MKLLDYIKGLKKGKDAHRIELEAMQDPFLSEALDGYDSVKGDHADSITRMQKQISNKSQTKKSSLRYWSIAASILIAIAIGSYYFKMEKKTDMYSSTDLPKTNPQPPVEEIMKEEQLKQPPVAIISDNKNIQKEKNIRIQTEEIQASPEAFADQSVSQSRSEEYNKVAKVDRNLAMAQKKPRLSEKLVAGRIVDESGEPLIGASVIQKGTNVGAVTDLDGKFAFQTIDSSSLLVNYLGYMPKEVSTNAKESLLITMQADNLALNEVVVVGYETQRKQSITGSISSVKVKEKSFGKSEPVIGKKEYYKYLKENLIYPTDSACMNVKGTVVLQFIVDSVGNPTQIQVKKSICPSIDTEAIRLLNHGCKWTAGEDMVELKIKF